MAHSRQTEKKLKKRGTCTVTLDDVTKRRVDCYTSTTLYRVPVKIPQIISTCTAIKKRLLGIIEKKAKRFEKKEENMKVRCNPIIRFRSTACVVGATTGNTTSSSTVRSSCIVGGGCYFRNLSSYSNNNYYYYNTTTKATTATTAAKSTSRRVFGTTTTTTSTPTNNNAKKTKPKAVFLNASRLNYDNQLDFTSWETFVDCIYQPYDRISYNNDNEYIDKVVTLIDDAEIVIVKEIPFPVGAIPIINKTVKLICEAGTGYNNIPISIARQYGITVCNTPTYSTDAVAHMAITYLMNFSVSMFQQQAMLTAGDRRNFTGPFTLPLMELNNKTLGLVGGSGRIGTTVAQIALALRMNIIISTRAGSLPSTHALFGHPNVICTSDISYLLQNSDYVSIHTPLNDETRKSFGRTQIEQMKRSAFLINTSRGGVLNEEEFITCMKEQRIAGAGLDVTTTEPPSHDSPLWNLSNVYLSPHTGWRRYETRQRLVTMTADNIQAYVTAQSPNDYINVVN